MYMYVEHIIQRPQADLHKLCGCVLVCDWPPEATCEADILAELVFEECRAAPSQQEPTRWARRRGGMSGACRVTMALAGIPATVADVIPYRAQEALVQSFISLYPANFFVSLAVTSFNRISRFTEAMGRRLLYILTSLYFDDAHITDWASSKGKAQAAFSSLNELLVTPFAEEKRQHMRPKKTNLGLRFSSASTDVLEQGVWQPSRIVNTSVTPPSQKLFSDAFVQSELC